MPLTHRGFSAWIECNGQNLPEYLVAVDEEAHRVSCWIPGAVGQRFTVFWQDHAGQVDSCAFITLDGLLVPGRFLFGDGIASRGGVRVSKTTERPFVFQNLPDQDSPSQGTVKDAGMITLKIKRIKRVVGRWANPLQPLPVTSVLGKRKAGDLCVGFGEEERVYAQHDTTWTVVPYEDDAPSGAKPSTYVSFVFRYRSLEFLEAQGIITEQKKPTQLVRAPIRQVTLPSHLQSEASSPPATHPAKKQKLMTSTSSAMASSSGLASTSRMASGSDMPFGSSMLFAPGMPSGSGMASTSSVASISRVASTSRPASASAVASTSYKVPTSRVTSTSRIASTSRAASTSYMASTSRAVSVSTRAFPTNARRPSAEFKRAASWTGTSSTTLAAGRYNGEAQFFLPRTSLPGSTSMGVGLPNDSGTSESPEPPG